MGANNTPAAEVLIDEPLVRALLRARWEELAATPPWRGPRLWLHGDLYPANVLVHRGTLSAVIDFGGLTSGDPAIRSVGGVVDNSAGAPGRRFVPRRARSMTTPGPAPVRGR